MTGVDFVPLAPHDVPEAADLSARIGWNQTEADWRRLIALNPQGAVGVRAEGTLVASATLAAYGPLHWIGMVIVDEAHRGKGLGKAVLARIIELSGDLGADTLGLDATHLGEPLYRKHDFVAVRPLDRWVGAPRPIAGSGRTGGAAPNRAGTASLRPQPLREAHWPGLLKLDRDACGVDREALLRALHADDGTHALLSTDGERVRGYAFLRPGREHAHLGPLVAEQDPDFAALLSAASERLAAGSVLMDAPRKPGTSALLEESGMRIQRRLLRMTQGRAEPALMGDRVRLATALEWG